MLSQNTLSYTRSLTMSIIAIDESISKAAYKNYQIILTTLSDS